MKISNTYRPSFGALYVNNFNIGKLDKNTNEYVSVPASFLQIDPKNDYDIEALYNVATYWGNDSKFATNVYYAACAIRNNSKYYKNNKIFVLTTQLEDFDKLDDEKILGIIHVNELEPKHYFGEHIEVKPDIVYTVTPEYKGVGTAMDKSVKKLCNKMSIFPLKLKSVRNFVKRNGYVECPQKTNLFVWSRDVFERD